MQAGGPAARHHRGLVGAGGQLCHAQGRQEKGMLNLSFPTKFSLKLERKIRSEKMKRGRPCFYIDDKTCRSFDFVKVVINFIFR